MSSTTNSIRWLEQYLQGLESEDSWAGEALQHLATVEKALVCADERHTFTGVALTEPSPPERGDAVLSLVAAVVRGSWELPEESDGEVIKVCALRAKAQWEQMRRDNQALCRTLHEASVAIRSTWAGDPHGHETGVVFACEQYAEAERVIADETGDAFDGEDYSFADTVHALASWWRESEAVRLEGLPIADPSAQRGPGLTIHGDPETWKAQAAAWLRESDEAGDAAHAAFVCDSVENDAAWERVDDVLAALADALALRPSHGERPTLATNAAKDYWTPERLRAEYSKQHGVAIDDTTHPSTPTVSPESIGAALAELWTPQIGDRVEAWRAFTDDEAEVIGWASYMERFVGNTGTVEEVDVHGNAYVLFADDPEPTSWWWHTPALRPTSNEPGSKDAIARERAMGHRASRAHGDIRRYGGGHE